MILYFRKLGNGIIPIDKASADYVYELKQGTTISADIKQPRNYEHHKKWWALVELMFEQKADEFGETEVEGQKVRLSFERFRKDVIVRTGRYERVFDIDGNLTLEADSISFAKMSQEEFNKLYSDTVQIALDILPKWNKEQIIRVLEFL